MIIIPVVSQDIYYNFALEYYLMSQKHFEEPVFMLWSTTPTVMLGKYQDAYSELNLDYIQQHQIHVVRRLSGGGAIYTDQGGFQFTFIRPDNHNLIDFSAYLTLVVKALAHMNIQAQLTSRNDLSIRGKKFSGSAQYRHDHYVLHHGSLLFDTDRDAMVRALHVDNLKLLSKHIASVHERTINLSSLRPDLTATQFGHTLVQEILKQVGQYSVYLLKPAEEKIVQEIADTKFNNPDFIYHKIPKTEFTKKAYIKGGGLVRCDVNLNKGYICDIHLSGDFFSNLDPKTFARTLDGTSYTPDAIKPVLVKFLQSHPIMGVDASDLVSVLFS